MSRASCATGQMICCLGAGEDFNYPATTGERPQKTWAEKQMGAYIADLMDMAAHDASVFSDIAPVRACPLACRR